MERITGTLTDIWKLVYAYFDKYWGGGLWELVDLLPLQGNLSCWTIPVGLKGQ